MNNPIDTIATQNRYSAQATALIRKLDARIDEVFLEVQRQPFWQTFTDSKTSDATLKALVREVFLTIYWYGKHITEAEFHMVARLPKTENKLLKSITLFIVEEAEHPEWALRDFEILGGKHEYALSSPMSPAAFAVTGVWWRMAVAEEPFGYFGAEYLFEYLTFVVTQPLVEIFKQRGFKAEGFQFIIEHATEDEKHAKLLRHLVCDIVTRYPQAEAAIIRCFDYFRQVYPIPVWTEAYQRAIASVVK